MALLEVQTVRSAEPRLCLHCGSELSRGELGLYCCAGCESVHALLQDRGLGEYYRLRDRRGSRPAPAPVSEAFDYMDDPSFIATYANEDGTSMQWFLEGVHCAACVWLTEKLPELVAGVQTLELDLSSGVARVKLQPGGSFARAARELNAMGYRPHPVRGQEANSLRRKDERTHLIRLGVAGMASGNIMLLSIALYAGATGSLAALFRWASFALFLPVLAYSAVPFYRGAWGAFRARTVPIDVPIVLGLGVGALASFFHLAQGSDEVYFDSISSLVFLLLATRYLLRKVNQKAQDRAQFLRHVIPAKANRQRADGSWEVVSVDALRVGDRIQVMPGDCFPADATVVSGESAVDGALLTGESVPVHMTAGKEAYAGTINLDAPLVAKVLRAGASTRLGQIVAEMEASLVERAPIVSQLDRVGRAFVLATLGLSVVGFILGMQYGMAEGIRRAIAIAIIVCPCTFALATPLAFSIAIRRASERGVWIKSAEWIERLSQVRAVILDKTGTLTDREVDVAKWEERLAGATAALLVLESRSSHPFARAVLKHFGRQPSPIGKVEGFRDVPGRGPQGWIDGSLWEIIPEGEVIHLRKDGQVAGVLDIVDHLRGDSAVSVQCLRAQGLETYLLTGDSVSKARWIASAAGIPSNHVIARVGPEDKSRFVKSIPNSLMAGDGANDAVALASAFASIAVQGGMEAAVGAAGAYCARPGIGEVPRLITIARETMRVIRRNLAFAILYNLFGITAALTGHLSPLFAAVLMPASAFTVFLSTIVGTRRLRRGIA